MGLAELLSKMGVGNNVSPKNRLVNSYIYGVDNRKPISPDNRLIHADLGQDESKNPEQKVEEYKK